MRSYVGNLNTNQVYNYFFHVNLIISGLPIGNFFDARERAIARGDAIHSRSDDWKLRGRFRIEYKRRLHRRISILFHFFDDPRFVEQLLWNCTGVCNVSVFLAIFRLLRALFLLHFDEFLRFLLGRCCSYHYSRVLTHLGPLFRWRCRCRCRNLNLRCLFK